MSGGRPEEVRRLADGREVLVHPDKQEVERRIGDIEVGFGGPPLELLPRAAGLKWLQLGGAGADRVFDHPAAGRDFLVTNASGVHPTQISEHLLALMLAFARGIHTSVRNQASRVWQRQEDWKVFELAGRRVLLVGLGAIGGRFAEAAAALGMEVVALRARPELGSGAAARVAGIDSLRDELPHADFVVITAPLTPATRHLIGEREIALMKPSSYIFNIGRGPVIDEAALVRALQEGRIAGAGLDVFEQEPLPAESPLWALPNVIVTAHYAGVSPRYGERLWAIFLDNLARYLDGKPLRNVVVRERGY
jgi:phosphoglycerate dehydrogenase-like enzyme